MLAFEPFRQAWGAVIPTGVSTTPAPPRPAPVRRQTTISLQSKALFAYSHPIDGGGAMDMRRFGWVALALVFLMLASAPASRTEKRVALLIGNEAYTSEIGRLANPHNDVALLEQALKSVGFDVAVERDAGLGALTRAVNAYARRLQTAGPSAVGFFYYTGHGASDGSTNYLIPVDVKTTETGELWDQSQRLTEITRKLKAEAGNATAFVVF